MRVHCTGFVEYGLIIVHTISGITVYSPTLLGLHALLEVPVLALTGTVLTAQHRATFPSRLPHITSIAQTFTCLVLHSLWMFYLRHTRSWVSGAIVPPAGEQEELAIVHVVIVPLQPVHSIVD